MFEISESSIKGNPVMNDYLKNATTKINNYHKITKNAILGISLILAHITEFPNAYFENSGFATISEYASTMFGYKKAYTYKLIKISKFIKIKSKDNEIIQVKDLIDDKIEEDYWFDIVKDADGFEYSPSQMLELIPLTEKQIEDNIKELDSSLTCKELRSIVKGIISPAIETTATDPSEETTEETTEPVEEKIQLTDKDRLLQMLEICSNMENEEIKSKIVNVFQKSLKVLDK